MDESSLKIYYTNWKGETRWRLIKPLSILWSTGNKWHKEPQWLLYAYDLEEKDSIKGFALLSIHKILPGNVAEVGNES